MDMQSVSVDDLVVFQLEERELNLVCVSSDEGQIGVHKISTRSIRGMAQGVSSDVTRLQSYIAKSRDVQTIAHRLLEEKSRPPIAERTPKEMDALDEEIEHLSPENKGDIFEFLRTSPAVIGAEVGTVAGLGVGVAVNVAKKISDLEIQNAFLRSGMHTYEKLYAEAALFKIVHTSKPIAWELLSVEQRSNALGWKEVISSSKRAEALAAKELEAVSRSATKKLLQKASIGVCAQVGAAVGATLGTVLLLIESDDLE